MRAGARRTSRRQLRTMVILELPHADTADSERELPPGRAFLRLDSVGQIKSDPSEIPAFDDQVVATYQWPVLANPPIESPRCADNDVERLLARLSLTPRHDLHQDAHVLRIVRNVSSQIYVRTVESAYNRIQGRSVMSRWSLLCQRPRGTTRLSKFSCHRSRSGL